jgi:hypothetical protein
MFNLKKLNELEGKKKYCVEVSNRFPALEDLGTEVDINRAREAIRKNIKLSAKEGLGYYELRKCNTLYEERCSLLNSSGYRNQVK